MEERVLTGIFLCSEMPNKMLETHKPEWNERAGTSFEEKCEVLGVSPTEVLAALFPWEEALSEGIEHEPFAQSYFTKPDVFLRLRPRERDSVRPRLKSAHVPFKDISTTTISVSPKEKVDQILSIDYTAVIQDLSSQKVGDFLKEVLMEDQPKVWDCCAASGGKSILAYDINPTIKLTVSDIRPQILNNLEARFETAGITKYNAFVTDLSSPQSDIPNASFDVIIADVPCTGSGTWGRNPEQLFYFDEARIGEYALLQRSIITNAVHHLKPGGALVYITCSVFKQENEENVGFIEQELGLKCIRSGSIPGYELKADSMFAAVFKRG